MTLPPPLDRLTAEELRAAFVAIQDRGPYPEAIRRTIQYLGSYGYATVSTIHHAPVDGVARVEIGAAQMTERGALLLHELQLELGEI